jgi:hypothetical protein
MRNLAWLLGELATAALLTVVAVGLLTVMATGIGAVLERLMP